MASQPLPATTLPTNTRWPGRSGAEGEGSGAGMALWKTSASTPPRRLTKAADWAEIASRRSAWRST